MRAGTARTPIGTPDAAAPQVGTDCVARAIGVSKVYGTGPASVTALDDVSVDLTHGKLTAIPGFTVAGKTGTAQKAAAGGGYSHDRFVATCIGFVPAESPRAVIAVVIDEPKGKIYGGDVAAPAFSALGAETLRILREAARDVSGRVTPAFELRDDGGDALADALVTAAGRRR